MTCTPNFLRRMILTICWLNRLCMEQLMVSFLLFLEVAQLLEIISEDFNILLKSQLNVLLIEFLKEFILRKISFFLRINHHQSSLTLFKLTHQNPKLILYVMMQHKLLQVLHQSFTMWMKMKILIAHPPHLLKNLNHSQTKIFQLWNLL